MRIRTIAGSVLAAAGLMTALTGAASASTPDPGDPSGEAIVVTCEDGKAAVRPLTEDERAMLKAVRAGEGGSAPAGKVGVDPGAPRVIHVGPPGDVDHDRPHAKRVKVLYAGSERLPGEKARFACAGPGEHLDE
jgi:hypothetical protein